jgi:predicted RNA polymerase sigma factor
MRRRVFLFMGAIDPRSVGIATPQRAGFLEPLILKAIQGMSYREIGRVLNLPETTIETRIARGRKMLRELALADTGSQAPESFKGDFQ